MRQFFIARREYSGRTAWKRQRPGYILPKMRIGMGKVDARHIRFEKEPGEAFSLVLQRAKIIQWLTLSPDVSAGSVC
jgi:hypothetical protein